MKEEGKLEEGEACDDSTVDPDIALSYIDEKLRDVLGHFQKDFEDGVSSENLGSKFGGYGSFLPTYQRSPSWTCARTPPEADNNNKSISPSDLRPERGRRSSSTSLSGRPLASSAYSSVTVHAQKTPAANAKTNSTLRPAQDEGSTSRSELVKKPTNISDQKAAKLHAAVGIGSLSTQNKAEIYSGLGLDVSPSSSLDDSPMHSEGLSQDLKDSRYESPTSILQIMTSYPMDDGLLLSPLSDDLICLTEKGIQERLGTSVALVNGTRYANKKASEARKQKSDDRDVLGTGYGNDNRNGSTIQPKKDVDLNVIACEELVSDALELPLGDPPEYTAIDSSNGTKQDGLQSSNDIMMNHQEDPNFRSLSGTSHSLDENCHQQSSIRNSLVVEKRRHKNKEKKLSLDNRSDRGTKDAKTRNISEVELDVSSKKIKRDDARDDVNRTFCPVVEKPGWSSSSGLPHSMSGMIQDKCKNKDSEDDSKKDVISANNPEAHISDVSMHKGKCDNKESSTKRKGSELRDSLTCNPQASLDAAVNADPSCQASQYACKTENSDLGSDKERKNDHQCQNSVSVSNGKRGSSSRHKEKSRAPESDSDHHKTKNPDILNVSTDQMPLDEQKMTPGKNKSQEKYVFGLDRLRKSSKNDSSGKLLEKNVKGAEVRADVASCLDKRQAAPKDRDDQRSSKKLVSNKSEPIKVSSNSPLTRDQNETVVFKEPVPGSERENGANSGIVDALEREKSNASRQGKKTKSHHGNLHSRTARKDQDVPSPGRKDSSSQAATNAIKEATNLKHLADRLKNSGSSESTGIYFQAALKFLHGASLLELDSSKHGELNQSRRIYSSTAKLCQFCGHEYEKLKDMAAAALAYKCMEVAYMRVIYSSQSDANRYRNELQTALQIFPPGESPFSSVSDVDNLNNSTIVDKAASVKFVGSPQVAGTHAVSARNGSSVMRLINLAQEVTFAMEASRKSRVAFAAATPGPGDSQREESALSVKKALDFNFQDVDGLLRLVRIAMESISH